MIFEDIASGAKVPVNKQASKINEGDKYESSKKILTGDQETPFPVYESELDGKRFGNFTVMGYFGKTKSKKAGKYSVRCDCGMYSLRTARAIKNPKNDIDCCERCREVRYLKRNHDYESNKKK